MKPARCLAGDPATHMQANGAARRVRRDAAALCEQPPCAIC